MQVEALDFERLLQAHRGAVERYVRFRLAGLPDAEDALQETLLRAFCRRDTLKDPAAFKPWLLRIARNCCSDHLRLYAGRRELPLDEGLADSLVGEGDAVAEPSAVQDTLELLSATDRQILRLHYLGGHPQARIAAALGIPLGTVKSRLHSARARFRQHYPVLKHKEETQPMHTASHISGYPALRPSFPGSLPACNIVPMDGPPFEVVWEELQGWFLVPRLGERISWAIYDHPSRELAEAYHLRVLGKAAVHGVEGVEIEVREEGDGEDCERRFIAQLTETHCRYLAESHLVDGRREIRTFLDADEFLEDWGYGEDNCGKPLRLSCKGQILREGGSIRCASLPALDVVGAWRVEIGGRSYDTICVMELSEEGVAVEQYLDRQGRTVLWRRFNREDWALERFGGKPWSERLPDNARLSINGSPYVHWYDCITSRVL